MSYFHSRDKMKNRMNILYKIGNQILCSFKVFCAGLICALVVLDICLPHKNNCVSNRLQITLKVFFIKKNG